MERCCQLLEATPLQEEVEAAYDLKRVQAKVRDFLRRVQLTKGLQLQTLSRSFIESLTCTDRSDRVVYLTGSHHGPSLAGRE